MHGMIVGPIAGPRRRPAGPDVHKQTKHPGSFADGDVPQPAKVARIDVRAQIKREETMKNQISKYGPMLLSNAGRCRKCLHGSLGMAMLAWCAVAVSAYLHPGSAFGILASALAIAANGRLGR